MSEVRASFERTNLALNRTPKQRLRRFPSYDTRPHRKVSSTHSQ